MTTKDQLRQLRVKANMLQFYCDEPYTPERIAEFLLNNAVGPEDYATALEEIRRLGIDPAAIPHQPPAGT